MPDFTTEELKEKISKYRAMGEIDLVAKYEAELAKKSDAKGTPIAGDIVLNVSPEDFEKSSSKFVSTPGLHKSVFGMPYWKNPGKSLAFPFTIIEGAEENKEGILYPGVSKEASWKIKEILKSLGINYKNQNGLVAFNPGEVAGKVAKVLYAQSLDERPADEGGTGKIFTKPADGSCVYPADATLESIGMTLQSLLLRSIT